MLLPEPFSCTTPRISWRQRNFPKASRQNRKGPRGKTETVLDLRPAHDNQGPLGGHLVEIGHDLDLITATRQEIGFGRHFFGRIRVHRFMPNRRDPALFDEEFYGLQRPARKWRALEPF